MQSHTVVLLLTLAPTACSQPAPQQASATPTAATTSSAGGFVASHDADAVDQPASHNVVGHLEAGKSYSLEKRGGPGHNWCKVKVGEASGWVECSVGQASASGSSSAPSAGGGNFDYYVLTLSWSPAFCETPAGEKYPEQCAGERHYAFVVHGLWPQNERGWPEHCSTAPGPSRDLATKMLDIMPSEHLVDHEWETHGTCSGLSADDYFARIRDAYKSIHIPDPFVSPKQGFTTSQGDIVSAFTKANPGLSQDEMAVECKHDLSEVRICLDKDLRPRKCSSDVHNACKGSVTVPPIR